LDKATASTKISGEQCTWPDSDRVKCHCSLPVLTVLSCRTFVLTDSFPISLVLAAFLLPPVLFLPVSIFLFLLSFAIEFEIRQYGALNGAITIGRRDIPKNDRNWISRYHSSSLARDACRRCTRLSIATKHDRRKRSQRAINACFFCSLIHFFLVVLSILFLLCIINRRRLLFSSFIFLSDDYILVFLVFISNFSISTFDLRLILICECEIICTKNSFSI